MNEAVSESGAATFRGALGSTPLRRLLLAHAIATVAQLVVTLAVGFEVHQRTDSGLASGLSVALGFAPYAVLSGYAGVLADRYSRSAMLGLSALARGGLAVLLVLALSQDVHWGILVALVGLLSAAATPSYPALVAATGQCVPEHQQPSANALATSVENVAWIAGPGTLALLEALELSYTQIVLVCTVGLAGAGVIALAAALPMPTAALHDSGRISVAWQALRARPELANPMWAAACNNFLYGYLVMVIVLVIPETDSHADLHSRYNAALTAGALLALVVVNRISATRSHDLLRGLMIAYVLVLAAVSLDHHRPETVGLIALAGALSLVAEVLAVTVLQADAEDRYMARLFGIYDQINVGAIALGSLAAGFFSLWIAPEDSLLITCAVLGGGYATLTAVRTMASASR